MQGCTASPFKSKLLFAKPACLAGLAIFICCRFSTIIFTALGFLLLFLLRKKVNREYQILEYSSIRNTNKLYIQPNRVLVSIIPLFKFKSFSLVVFVTIQLYAFVPMCSPKKKLSHSYLSNTPMVQDPSRAHHLVCIC